MYGYIGAGLMGLFILMVLPAGMDNIQEDGKFYGAANLLVRDAAGNELFQQTVHNRLLDTGENYIVNQTFVSAGALVLDTDQMSAICVTNLTLVNETDTAASYSAPANTLTIGTGDHCHPTAPVIINDGKVVLGPEIFTGGADIGPGETIRSIAICTNNGGTDYADCDIPANAIAFAAIVTSSVQLGATETVDVTYTFDLSSPNS